MFGGTLNIDRGAGQGDNADPALDISFPHDGAAAECPTPLTGGTCVRANVYRNEGNNPLPTFFGHVFGRTEQGVRATATAQIVSGNASDCLKPWAVADRWTENVKRVCNNVNQFPPCTWFVAGTNRVEHQADLRQVRQGRERLRDRCQHHGRGANP